jgi:ferredoxin--NADP+ reductase
VNKIVQKKTLSSDVYEMVVEAPLIARARKAGQFIIVQIDTDWGERNPLTIADADPAAGTITIVFQSVGASTHSSRRRVSATTSKTSSAPWAPPTHIEKVGTVVCVGGGIGFAPLHPIAQAMKAAGNK